MSDVLDEIRPIAYAWDSEKVRRAYRLNRILLVDDDKMDDVVTHKSSSTSAGNGLVGSSASGSGRNRK